MKVKLLLTMFLRSILARLAFASEVEGVPVPPNVSHQAWDALLKKYVTDRGLVGYADWKKNQVDLAALDSYLKQFAEKPQIPGGGNDAAASLIKSLQRDHYPLDSRQLSTREHHGAQRFVWSKTS